LFLFWSQKIILAAEKGAIGIVKFVGTVPECMVPCGIRPKPM
jgi:hypothetical protein